MVTKFSDRSFKLRHLALGLVLALSLVACGSDGSSSGTQSSVMANNTTEPFIMNGVPTTMIEAGAEYHYQPLSNNPSGRVLAYNVVNKPDWATFSETTGELSGTPQESDVGTSGDIEIGASDGTTTATVGPFRIRVIPQIHTSTPPTVAVTISGTPAGSVNTGQQYRFLPVVENSGGQPLSFSIINRPTWSVFNTATGLLVGTPTSDNVGTYSDIVISVSAAGTPVSLSAFTVRVQAAPSDAPTIAGSPATTVASGGSYSFTPTVGDPNGNALTFSVMNAPSWTSFNAATGELSGTAPSGSQFYPNIVISVSDGSNSAALAPFSITVEASSGGGGQNSIKFHPGMYIELDPGSGGGGLEGWLNTIDSLKGAAGVTGVMLIQQWSSLEFGNSLASATYTQGAGSSAQGFAAIDQILQHCQAANLYFILGYEDRFFGGNVAGPNSNYNPGPGYLATLENGASGFLVAPQGSTWSGALQSIADVNNSSVWNREIALGQAYLARYDSNAWFEMWRTPETANGYFSQSGGSGAYEAYVQQYKLWMPAMRAAGPHTGVSISANFLVDPAQLSELFQAAAQSAIGVGGPDVKLDMGNFAGTSNIVYNGFEAGQDWRGTIPWISEVQTPDESGNASIEQLYNEAMNGSLSTGGSVRPNYMVWSFDAGWTGPNAFTNNQILTFIASVNGVTNTTRPSTY